MVNFLRSRRRRGGEGEGVGKQRITRVYDYTHVQGLLPLAILTLTVGGGREGRGYGGR